MALEKLFATQIVTWQPPLPQRAFPVQAAGSTTENMGTGGTSTDGKRYGYFVLNTSQWGVEEGFHTPPVQPGEKFQLFTAFDSTAAGSFRSPSAFENGTIQWSGDNVNSKGAAPDLFAISALTLPSTPGPAYKPIVNTAASAFSTATAAANAAAASFQSAGAVSAPGDYLSLARAAITAATAAKIAYTTANANPYTWNALGSYNAATTASSAAASAATSAAVSAAAHHQSAVAAAFTTSAAAMASAAASAAAAAAAASANGSRDGLPVGFSPLWTLKDPTVCTVQNVQQSSATAWYVYYSPNLAEIDTVVPGVDGIITLPQPFNPRYLGQVGHVSAVNYTFSIPGGPDQLTCTLAVDPAYRTDALNPGRIVTAHRGGSCIWEGSLTEPVPTSTGWQITCNGVGTYGSNFGAWWDENLQKGAGWTADAPVDLAISRGLRWSNHGIGKPAGIYLGPAGSVDPGSDTITWFLNLLCTGGSLTWELAQPAGASSWPPSPWELRVYPLPIDISGNPLAAGPSTKVQTKVIEIEGKKERWKRVDLITTKARQPPDLYLINTNPVGRTIANDYNTIILYYQVAPDKTAKSTKTATAAVFRTTFADAPGSVAAHGRMEYYQDISNAGPLTQAQAQAIGANILSKYIRANFTSAFSVAPGQLVNVGGFPVDLGLNYAGAMCTLQVVNAAAGGEVGLAPITFMIGQYQFDDETQTAQISAYQNNYSTISDVIAMLYPAKFA